MARYRSAGATREKLAQMLGRELTRMGVKFVPFDGNDLLPVSGYWKSQDVYRWESIGLCALHPETGSEMPMSIRGWERMTKITRSKGVNLSAERMPFVYEAWSGAEPSDDELLADANSHYSAAQLDEIALSATPASAPRAAQMGSMG